MRINRELREGWKFTKNVTAVEDRLVDDDNDNDNDNDMHRPCKYLACASWAETSD